MATNKYKDAMPADTIAGIRNMLTDAKLFTVEKSWLETASCVSVRLEAEGTEIGSNGKGTDAHFALASAYGELAERLMNMAPFKLSPENDPEVLQQGGYWFMPDEEHMPIHELKNCGNQWFSDIVRCETAKGQVYDIDWLLNCWKRIDYDSEGQQTAFTPLADMVDGSISYVPQIMLSKIYMTNGMCAGNTKEEALVQGISEVIERYVNKKVIEEGITPPDVPADYIRRYEQKAAIIRTIERRGRFRVKLKDCSLGGRFPVVCAILYDKIQSSYFVKFGSFPDFEIAAERTLTEMFQGQKLCSMRGMSPLLPESRGTDCNVTQIFVNGIGQYPYTMFYGKPSYEFKGGSFSTYKGNRELLAYYTELFAKLGKSILIRDASYKDISAAQVIIPGFSEIESFADKNSITEYMRYKDILSQINGIGTMTRQKMAGLADEIKASDYYAGKSGLQFYYRDKYMLAAALYAGSGDYLRAWKCCSYSAGRSLHYGGNERKFDSCACSYLLLRSKGMSDREALKYLLEYFDEDSAQIVSHIFNDNIFSILPPVSCYNCSRCMYRSNCKKRGNREAFVRMKELRMQQ